MRAALVSMEHLVDIKRRTRARNTMSITPLVDVVFLLLLFFALTLHFSPEEAISVDLPTSSSAEKQPETEIILTVSPEGALRLNGEEIPSEFLETELISLRMADDKRAVQVRADQQLEVGRLVAIIDAIRNAGFQHFDLMTQQTINK